MFGAKGDLVKVGAPLVEFAEGAEQDTGTIVGELGAQRATARGSCACRAARLGESSGVSGSARAGAQARCRSRARQGTGPGGTITRADVERAARSLTDAGPAEPLRGMRRAMAQRMTAAHAQDRPRHGHR